MKNFNLIWLICVFALFSCSEDNDDAPSEPQLIIKFKFDPNQARLNNFGQPSTIPTGNAA
jgi:hypothetical protein